MTHKILFISAALAITLLFGPLARADFLGLAPGDYNITLIGSAALCGGAADCTGTVHIPTGVVTNVNFDWAFQPAFHDFLWDDANLDISSSPSGLSNCAFESGNPVDSCDLTNDAIAVVSLNAPFTPGFSMAYLSSPSTGFPNRAYGLFPLTSGGGLGQPVTGEWVVTAVPEPNALLLFGGALSALWFCRRATGRG